MMVFTVVQARYSCGARASGLFAFGGRVDGGAWKATPAEPEWTIMRGRWWAGEWIGGIRADAVARSDMWRSLDMASKIQRHQGYVVDDVVPPAFLHRLKAQILVDRPWVGGVEQLSVGWPMRCFRSTVVWGTRAEMARVDRIQSIEGWDVWNDDSTALAKFMNVQEKMAPVSVIPTGVLWPWLFVNWAVWTIIAFAALSLFGVKRTLRGAWWHRRGRCRRCGYLLRGINGLICPECGFTPSAASPPIGSAMTNRPLSPQ
jgi:hypothetical protein